MKPQTRWNTLRIAAYGAAAGFAYTFITLSMKSPLLAAAAGEMLGGMVGGAILFAAVSGIEICFFA